MSETNEDSLEQMQREAAGGDIDNLITIATFPEPTEANVARTALESAGIPVFLQGENANTLIPMAFVAQLQVRAEDEAAAREVLGSPDSAATDEAAEDLAL
jgi:hypothetical protein